jgi:hypothetical protein
MMANVPPQENRSLNQFKIECHVFSRSALVAGENPE